ncbi:MAG: LysM peptidoglycan-binding domain-containing protein, partial [Arcobacter sp.]|nr:LysM peptidoglycan-binding domain-containing protein [Arcobacter sp.]
MSINLILNFTYPFKKLDKEEEYHKSLCKEKKGNYLFSQHGLWHGGMHFDSFFGEKIKCIADGEIVAYRINTTYLKDSDEEEVGLYSTGFILVKHYFEYPIGNKLTFFTLYMHMADKSKYNEEKETSTTYTIKSGDSLSKIASQYKTTVAQIQKDNNIPNANSISVGQKLQIKSKSTDTKPKYIIEDPIYDSVQILTEAKSIKAGEVLGEKGIYGRIGQKANEVTHLEVFTKDDVKTFAQKAKEHYDNPKTIKEEKPTPIQIKIPKDKIIYKLKDIVKTTLNKADNIRSEFNHSSSIYNKKETAKGTILEIDKNSLKNNRYLAVKIGTLDVSSTTWTVYKNSITQNDELKNNIFENSKTKTKEETISITKVKKIKDKDEEEYFEYKEKTPKEYIKYKDCEEIHPITFDWAKVIDIKSKDKISIFDSLENYVIPTLIKDNMSLNDSFVELFKLIDKDNNSMLELLEIKEASKKALIKQTTSKYIVKHSSEWHEEINMADVFLDIFNKHKKELKNSCEIDDHYKKQKERIENLSFFTECKNIPDFPKSDEVYHINPIG